MRLYLLSRSVISGVAHTIYIYTHYIYISVLLPGHHNVSAGFQSSSNPSIVKDYHNLLFDYLRIGYIQTEAYSIFTPLFKPANCIF